MADEQTHIQRLSTVLKVIAIIFVAFFTGFYVLVLLDASFLAEGTVLGRLLRWEPYNLAYEGMVSVVYIVWGIMLWRASSNPREHRSLIDFTIWGNLAHAAFMLGAAIALEGELLHAAGDVAFLGAVGVVLLLLKPRAVTATAP